VAVKARVRTRGQAVANDPGSRIVDLAIGLFEHEHLGSARLRGV